MKIKYFGLVVNLMITLIIVTVLAIFYYSMYYAIDEYDKDTKKDDLSSLILEQQINGLESNNIYFYG